jgi:hypothetical protein
MEFSSVRQLTTEVKSMFVELFTELSRTCAEASQGQINGHVVMFYIASAGRYPYFSGSSNFNFFAALEVKSGFISLLQAAP